MIYTLCAALTSHQPLLLYHIVLDFPLTCSQTLSSHFSHGGFTLPLSHYLMTSCLL